MMMKLVSGIALAAALVLGGAAGTASAAPKKEEAPKATFSAPERAALAPLQTAVTAKNWDTAKAALPAAQAAAQGPDAKYVLGRFELDIGLGTNDESLEALGVDTMIDSGKIPATEIS